MVTYTDTTSSVDGINGVKSRSEFSETLKYPSYAFIRLNQAYKLRLDAICIHRSVKREEPVIDLVYSVIQRLGTQRSIQLADIRIAFSIVRDDWIERIGVISIIITQLKTQNRTAALDGCESDRE